MSKKATLTDVSSGYTQETTLNDNFDALNDKFDNTLSLDGSTPNSMGADLDLDSNDILNAGTVNTSNLYINGVQAVSLSATPSWEGAWVTATAYVVNDIVSNDGSSYICVEAHTSGTFSTDLSASKWELFAQKGSAGAGSGDMLAANNLSDVADAATSRANISAIGGTSPTLGGDLVINGHGLTVGSDADGDLYSRQSGALGRIAKGTGDQLLKMNSGATGHEYITALGQQTIWMPAGAMTATTTNGAASGSEELATNDVMKSYLAFDDSTNEYACFEIQMPKSWDEGTLVAQFVWYTTAITGDCIWGLQATAVADDDAQDTAYGTAQEVTDTAKGTAKDVAISGETSAITVSGTPGAEELVQFKVYRDGADVSDTMTGDALLLGVKIHYTTEALTDD